MEYDAVALFIPIVSMTVAGLVVIAFFYFRYKSRTQLQETVRSAIDKGSDLTPDLVDRLAGPKSSPLTDLRRGMIWVSVGIAFILFGAIIEEEDAFRALSAIGMFPLLIGIAYLIMWKFGHSGDKAGS